MPGRSTIVPRRPVALASLALALLLPLSASQAQKVVGVISDQRMPDSAQMAATAAMSIRMQSPATLALTVKQELGLSPEQVQAIEARAQAEVDSGRVRYGRLMELARQNRQNKQGPMAAGMSWTGPIDEAAIRSAVCEQAQAQADMVIGLMRDRHALGALLTPDQRRQFEGLQDEIVSRMLRGAHK